MATEWFPVASWLDGKKKRVFKKIPSMCNEPVTDTRHSLRKWSLPQHATTLKPINASKLMNQ